MDNSLFPQLDPARSGELQVVFATDLGYASRVEVAAHSLLQNTTCPVRIVIIGTPEVAGAFARLKRILPHFKKARLEMVFPAFLRQAAKDHDHHFLPPAAFGRMLVPHMMTDRVLYLDGDTLVRHDMAEVLDLDLGGNLTAAALDLIVMRNVLRAKRTDIFKKKRHRDAARRAERSLRGFLETGCNLDRYFNSGVMILDCDAIKQHAEIMREMLNFQRARDFITFDQDLINLLFADHMAELDAAWNTWSGVGVTKWAPFLESERDAFAKARSDPKIVHYYGQTKPWGRWNYRHFTRGYRWHRVYRQSEAALDRLVDQML